MNVFVTGANGFLGSHFLLRRLERRGLAVGLVRAATVEAAWNRVQQSLRVAATGYAAVPPARGRLVVQLGELSSERCGVSRSAVDGYRREGIGEFWHFAASLAFEERSRETIEAQNVGGALNALDLAIDLGASRFVYVSTAYTAGRRTGVVPETLHPVDAEFNNVYEETKCRAEHALVRAAAASRIDLRIVRPTIVVGSVRTASPAGGDTGFYGFVRKLRSLGPTLAGVGASARMAGDPATPLHLVPVDRLIGEMIDLADLEFPAGPIYHLGPRRPITVGRALELVCREVGIPPIRIGRPEPAEPKCSDGRLDAHMPFYGNYLRDPKTFERSLPGDCEIGLADLARLTRAYLRRLRKYEDRKDPPPARAA